MQQRRIIFGVVALDWGILSQSLGPRLRLIRNHLNTRSIAVSDPFGLPTGSLTVMTLISANPGSSQKQIADWAGITGAGLVNIIDELEERKLVSRERSPTDRRRNIIVLASEGADTLKKIFAAVSGIEDPIRNELSPEEMKLFLSFIDRIATALEQDNN